MVEFCSFRSFKVHQEFFRVASRVDDDDDDDNDNDDNDDDSASAPSFPKSQPAQGTIFQSSFTS